MPLPLKKKSEAAAIQMPPWHPNFRNYEKLPDIKKVRTAFFVNTVAITVSLAVAGYVGYQEYKLLDVRGQKEATQANIDRDKRVSDVAIRNFRQFQEGEKKLQEIDAFVKSRPALSPMLLHLGQNLPKNIALSNFDFRERGLSLRGVIRGAPELATAQATAYVEQLRKDEKLAALFDEVLLTNINRDPLSGRLVFELFLKLKGEKGDKK